MSHCRMKKNIGREGSRPLAHVNTDVLQSQQQRRRPTRKTTLVSWFSRYHRHFVRLRLSLLASQGESELPEVASQRSDERTHILITFGLAE